MDIDFPDNAGDLVRGALGLIDNLIWFVVIAAGFLLSRRKQKQPAARPIPSSGDGWSGGYRERTPIDPGTQPGFGSTFSTPEPERSTSDDPLAFGSLFDDSSEQRTEQRPGQRVEQTKWGFDETEWGSSFGPKKSSEPTITQG